MSAKYLLCLIFVTISGEQLRNEGDECVDRFSNTLAVCRYLEDCRSARDDYRKYGVQPTFCSRTKLATIVCCRDGISPTNKPNINDRPVWSPGVGNSNQAKEKRISVKKCEEYSKAVTHKTEYITLTFDPEVMEQTSAKCDYDKIQLIIGGESADVGEFPHMAAIGFPLSLGGVTIKCGGTLISERFVLTAGHCLSSSRDSTLSSAEPSIVRLGDHNINPDVYDGINPVDIPIKRIIKHPDYKPPKKYNDIGLLELDRDVDLSSAIRPACLWSKPDVSMDKKAIAIGWGITDNRKPDELSQELQKVSLDILDNDACTPLVKGIKNRHWNGFTDTQICAGELAGGKDTCQGDSGGPLMLTSKENLCIFYIVGVTSFGGVCGAAKTPAVYTRVSSYIDWIEDIVWNNY